MELTRRSVWRRNSLLVAWACLTPPSVGATLRPRASAAQPEPTAPAGAAPTIDAPPAATPVEGFRQARFGMTEQEVRQAVQRDFPGAANRILRATHPREKTTVLAVTVEDLLPDAGSARISYILGHTSKRLVQVNVVWASDGRTAARDEAVVAAANALRDHFQAQHRAPPDAVVANQQMGENAFLVFRAAQADGRMVLLLLSGVAAAGRAGRTPAPAPLTLQLSYIRNHASPDVFRIERGRF